MSEYPQEVERLLDELRTWFALKEVFVKRQPELIALGTENISVIATELSNLAEQFEEIYIRIHAIYDEIMLSK